MTKGFDCPLWYGALSLESGLRRRLCCHDETGSSEFFSGDFADFKILKEAKNSSLKGEIPKNCMGCFNIEEGNGYSPRNFYQDFFKDNSPTNALKYIDITFENICNLSCFSCKPIYSNKIEKEFKKLDIPFERTGLNAKEFQEKFNKFKSLALSKLGDDSLIVISGGEPALSKNVVDFLDDLILLDHTNTITLRVFSNLTISTDWILNYIDKFKRVEFIISIDAIESRAEYIRFPSNWKTINKNYQELIEKTSQHNNFEVNVHTVLSILNFDHIPQLIDYFLSSKLELFPSFTLVSSPTIYMIENLPKEKLSKFQNDNLKYLDNLDINSFNIKKKEDLESLLKNLRPNPSHLLLELIMHHRKLDLLRKTSLLDEVSYLK
ncbi:twitch domain-containing radical SAM protein [Halobacteriovorax sp. JY17]|uniref:twitch domain-containing radical SAM protein n=1 Tax=Halobacteriovorax sp. JY17 TaxID=2014617 RepID=UPI000C5DF019|nr:twitch domain-containing radical SAM protein [Halobacteriovorax sp. JY17]PIK14017.1 MAG: hypothetical protein CES88_13620 [Halobacteriovorax sp. JY17]